MIEHLRRSLVFVRIFSTPLIALAVADAGSTSPSLASYQGDFTSIQDLLQRGCANHSVDVSRATFAYKAYEKASGLLARLRGESQADALFVDHPTPVVEAEYALQEQQAQARASDELRTAQDQYEYDQREFQLGALDKSMVTRDRERIMRARARLESAKKPPAPEELKRVTNSRVAAAKSAMQALESPLKAVAEAVNQAQHCYSSAVSNGMLANPAMDDRTVSPAVVMPEMPSPAAPSQPFGTSMSIPLGGQSSGGTTHN